jgi:hypothetical protein
MVVKCRVPRDEVEDYVIRLRSGENLVETPQGLICKDAFDLSEYSDTQTAVIQAGFGP